LALKFNALISTIHSSTTIIPKLINVTITDEQAAAMHINVDVQSGSEEPTAITYPTNVMYWDDAATWLSNTFAWQHEGFGLYPGVEFAGCNGLNPFWYNVTVISPLCPYFPQVNELPDPWLWTAFVANGNDQDNIFKVASFPIYYSKMQAQAAAINATAGIGNIPANSLVINMALKGEWVSGGYNPLNCQSAPIIDGYVHTRATIVVANLGCMPLPN
jgi:hypothetical protein